MADDISNRPTAPVPSAGAPASPVEASALEAARERTIRVLTDRFADDTLSIEQFESRLDRMYKASTVAELEALLHEVETYRAQAPAVSPYSASYAPTPGPRRLLSIMSNTERTGRWVMPRQLTVRSLMSSVALDLREATLPAGVC